MWELVPDFLGTGFLPPAPAKKIHLFYLCVFFWDTLSKRDICHDNKDHGAYFFIPNHDGKGLMNQRGEGGVGDRDASHKIENLKKNINE